MNSSGCTRMDDSSGGRASAVLGVTGKKQGSGVGDQVSGNREQPGGSGEGGALEGSAIESCGGQAARRMRVNTVISSSCPKSCAACTMVDADSAAMAAVRLKPKTRRNYYAPQQFHR